MLDLIKSAKEDGYNVDKRIDNQDEKRYVGYLSWRVDMMTAKKIRSIEDAKPYIYMMQRYMPDSNFEKFYVDIYNPRNRFQRPELYKLLKECNEGQIDVIVIPSIKTLSLSMSEIIDITRRLKSLPKPVYIFIMAEMLNSESNSFEMDCQLLSVMYQEQKNINRRKNTLSAYIKAGMSKIALKKL